MQPYYAMKLKCFVLRLIMGSAVLLMGISIIIAIIREMIGCYDEAGRIAYILGLVIAALVTAFGLFMIYQAFHFERFVFGHSSRDYALLKKDMEAEGVVSAGNLVATQQFLLLFTMHLFRMCTVIKTQDVVACFEDPVYGSIAKPTEYTLYIYDRSFKLHTIVLGSRQAEAGHKAKEKICSAMPWIYSDNRDTFMDMMMTKSGRRALLKKIEKNKYQVQSDTDVEKEAEDELNQLASEAKEKLNFHSILGRTGKKNN